jgi:tetratricopeptide (TPR) repeat protein
MDRVALSFSKALTAHRIFPLLLFVVAAQNVQCADVTELIRKGDALDAINDNRNALPIFLEADKADPNNAEILRRIAKQYAELVVDAKSKAEQKSFAEQSVEYGKRAVSADSKNALAHLSLAICYGKLTFCCDNRTKVECSKLVREETIKSIELDPKNDFAYHMLGRWNYELANMNGALRLIATMIYGGLPAASNEEAVKYFQKAIALDPDRVRGDGKKGARARRVEQGPEPAVAREGRPGREAARARRAGETLAIC